MPYATDLSAQISATRALAQRVRQLAAVLSLDDERARLLAHAVELEHHADEQEQGRLPASSPIHLAVSGRDHQATSDNPGTSL